MEQMFVMRCCMDGVSVVAWTFAEYSRQDQLLPTSVFSSRVLFLDRLSVEHSETAVDTACPPRWTMLVHFVVRAFSSPIAFRRQALQLRQRVWEAYSQEPQYSTENGSTKVTKRKKHGQTIILSNIELSMILQKLDKPNKTRQEEMSWLNQKGGEVHKKVLRSEAHGRASLRCARRPDWWVGELFRSVCGTRDARWQQYLTEHREVEFITGRYNACVFCNLLRNISVLAHGNDCVSFDKEQDLKWMKSILHEMYDIASEIVGPRTEDKKQVKVLTE